ncbi:hypothetical protein GCM10027570_23710 [Streptomonospora sediminis]
MWASVSSRLAMTASPRVSDMAASAGRAPQGSLVRPEGGTLRAPERGWREHTRHTCDDPACPGAYPWTGFQGTD